MRTLFFDYRTNGAVDCTQCGKVIHGRTHEAREIECPGSGAPTTTSRYYCGSCWTEDHETLEPGADYPTYAGFAA